MSETSRQTYDRWVRERHANEAYRNRCHRSFGSWKADLWLSIVLWLAVLAVIGVAGYLLSLALVR